MKNNFLFSMISSIVFFLIWFAFVFVGDVAINGWSILVPISIFVFLIISLWVRSNIKIENNKNRFSYILILTGLALSLIPSFKAPFSEDLFYYASFFGVFISIIFILFIHNNFFYKKEISLFSFFILIITFLYAITIKYDDSRLDIIYGPNVLYRIILFILGVILVCFFNEKKIIYKIIKITSILLASYLVFRTGSRGGLVSLGVILLVYTYHITSLRNFLFFSSMLIGVLIYLLSRIIVEDYRILKFDGESSEVRLDKVSAINNFVSEGSFFLGSLNPSKYTGVHPHNVLIESLIYHGFFYYLIIQVAIIITFLQVWRNKKIALLFIPYTGIFIGMFFSGSYIDNYVGVGLAILISLLFLFKKSYLIKVI